MDSLTRGIRELREANEYLKSQVRVMKEIIDGNGGKMPKHCKSCKHFIQHYTRDNTGYRTQEYNPIDWGHCTMSGKGIKNRHNKHATDEVCEFYEIGEYGR